MDTEKIIDAVMRDGGGTFTSKGEKVERTHGYAIARVEGTYYKIRLEDSDIASAAVASIAKRYPDDYVGLWIDEGYIHIDPVVIEDFQEQALYLGKQYNQKAIYSFETGKAIEVE